MKCIYLVFLVLIIPFHLLWHIKINLRQKLGLGITLCLSIMMIIIAIIRISAVRIGHTGLDMVWGLFWNQMEACTALIMVSFSAFRSFFVARESRVRDDQNRQRFWYMDKKDRLRSAWRRRQMQSGSEEMDELPDIPRATLTGMRTFVHGGKPKVESQLASLSTERPTTVVESEAVEEIGGNVTSADVDEVSQF